MEAGPVPMDGLEGGRGDRDGDERAKGEVEQREE